MTDRKYRTLIVDLLNLYHRAFAVIDKDPEKSESFSEECVGLVLDMINSLIRKYALPTYAVVFALDNYGDGSLSHLSRRKRIDSDYKKNRKVESVYFYKLYNLLQLILKNYSDSYMTSEAEGMEADDLVPYLTKKYGEDSSVLLISTDFDWSAHITKNVHWLTKHELYDVKRFEEERGFYPSPSSVSIYKAIRGDHSDDIIAGVPRLPESLLLEIIRKYDNIKNFFIDLENIQFIPRKWKDKIQKNKGRILLNHELVRSSDFINGITIEQSLHKCFFNRKKLQSMYRRVDLLPEDVDNRFSTKRESLEEWFKPEMAKRC